MFPRLICTFAVLLGCVASACGDAIDAVCKLQNVADEVALDIHGGRWSPQVADSLEKARKEFEQSLRSSTALHVWQAPRRVSSSSPESSAAALGDILARLQHVAALEMIESLLRGDVIAAREWRAVIRLPKFANAVEGALALQRLGGDARHRDEVARLLAREFALWQMTRAREKADALSRLIAEGRATSTLLHARTTEVQTLSFLPSELLNLVNGKPQSATDAETAFAEFLSAPRDALHACLMTWRAALEATYPNLLGPEDISRRERIVLKLLRLIPMEYHSGVRDGVVVIPIEYQEARSFTLQVRQIINELLPVWRESKSQTASHNVEPLLISLDKLSSAIEAKQQPSDIESLVRRTSSILVDHFGLTLKRNGTASAVVAESALEIRSLLSKSLAAALEKKWRVAEQYRLDAYVNFDLEIEARVLPRDPSLALRAEKTFLDGFPQQIGVKAALDARLQQPQIEAAYREAFASLDECVALLRVGLSPTAAAVSAILIIAREGLEAIVILAALLAGLRGPENAGIRHRIAVGAWLALLASAILFVISRTILHGLSRHGELLEAIISVVAVVMLLLVTNWVFHKYYWTGWNARLRELSKAAQRQVATRWENLALIGVGFMTIFREGFETTLFMQSLILEAGMSSVLVGLMIGGGFIALLGWVVFVLGKKLPYRKMLVVTGVLVIFVLFTFIGSTVRLFQTIGWLPVHPIPHLEFPSWVGVWLGIYPTWEGLLIPFATFAYVGGMWLVVKLSSHAALRRSTMQEDHERKNIQVVEQVPQPVLSK